MSGPITSTAGLLTACRKLVCVGRNYAAHAKELGNAVPTKPVIFMKPSSSLLAPSMGPLKLADEVTDLHHEIELGLVIGKRTCDISPAEADDAVCGYVLALDMTARNLQDEAKKGSLPWSIAKGYDGFAPISEFIPKSALPATLLQVDSKESIELHCEIDGVEKQRGSTSNMLFSMPYLVSYISRIFTLEAGDIILTGTPEGVGPVKVGQTMTGGITGFESKGATISVKVERREYRNKL